MEININKPIPATASIEMTGKEVDEVLQGVKKLMHIYERNKPSGFNLNDEHISKSHIEVLNT